MEALQKDKRYTYADYCAWGDDERWELIDGIPYAMAPAPMRRHQSISGEIFGQLRDYLKGKTCKVFAAPLDVRLNAESGDDTVVQPDVLVVCDLSKLDDKGCNGAPDLVVEILSPHTSRKDKVQKFNAYLRAGVREYWIVDPDSSTVTVYILKNGEYIAHAYTDADEAPVRVLDGCTIILSDVFAE